MLQFSWILSLFSAPYTLVKSILLLVCFELVLTNPLRRWPIVKASLIELFEYVVCLFYTSTTRRIHLPKHRTPKQFTPSICFMGGELMKETAEKYLAVKLYVVSIHILAFLFDTVRRWAAVDVRDRCWALRLQNLRRVSDKISCLFVRMLCGGASRVWAGPVRMVQARLGQVHGALRGARVADVFV